MPPSRSTLWKVPGLSETFHLAGGLLGFSTGRPSCLFSASFQGCNGGKAQACQVGASSAATPCVGCTGIPTSRGLPSTLTAECVLTTV